MLSLFIGIVIIITFMIIFTIVIIIAITIVIITIIIFIVIIIVIITSIVIVIITNFSSIENLRYIWAGAHQKMYSGYIYISSSLGLIPVEGSLERYFA